MMKNFISWRHAAFVCLSVLILASGCSDSDPKPPVIEVADFETTVDENLPAGTVLGTVEATTNKRSLSFEILSQSAAGAFAIDDETGEITVADASKMDFETNPTITAVVLAVNGKVESEINVTVHLQKAIWEGADFTFTKGNSADWTLAANQDKITDLVTITRQVQGPIYNFQWWQDEFGEDATYDDLYDDFWDDAQSTRIFTRQGGTHGVRWALLDDTGSAVSGADAWGAFELYGSLGDPTNFYSFHNIATIITRLENNTKVVGVPDDFNVEMEGGGTQSGTQMPKLVGKKLGVWLVEEDIYLTLTFTSWGSDGTGGAFGYTRSTKD
jgi:hypothetical protein